MAGKFKPRGSSINNNKLQITKEDPIKTGNEIMENKMRQKLEYKLKIKRIKHLNKQKKS